MKRMTKSAVLAVLLAWMVSLAQGNQASAQERVYPLRAQQHDKVEGTNMSMKTEVVLGPQTLTITTNTFTKVLARGWTGGVYVVLFTADGDGWISPIYRYGVDGCWVGRCDRTDTQIVALDPNIARKATQVAIVHTYTPRYGDLLEAIVQGTRRFRDAYAEIKSNLAPAVQDLKVLLD